MWCEFHLFFKRRPLLADARCGTSNANTVIKGLKRRSLLKLGNVNRAVWVHPLVQARFSAGWPAKSNSFAIKIIETAIAALALVISDDYTLDHECAKLVYIPHVAALAKSYHNFEEGLPSVLFGGSLKQAEDNKAWPLTCGYLDLMVKAAK